MNGRIPFQLIKSTKQGIRKTMFFTHKIINYYKIMYKTKVKLWNHSQNQLPLGIVDINYAFINLYFENGTRGTK